MTATNQFGLTLRQPPTAAPAFVVPAEYAHLPEKMRVEKKFNVWRKKSRAGSTKFDKVPYNPRTNKPANSPEFGVSLQEACAAEVAGGYDGVGFYTESPFMVCDVDDCINIETGDVDSKAAEIATTLDTFVELSVSGTGLHFWMLGEKPGNACRRGNLEIYDRKRFIAIGSAVPWSPKTIEDRTKELAVVYGRMLTGESKELAQPSTSATANEPAKIQSDGSQIIHHSGKALTNLLTLLSTGEYTPESKPFRVTDEYENWVEYPSQSEAIGALLVCLAAKHEGDSEKMEQEYLDSHLSEIPKWANGKWDRLKSDEIKSAIAKVKGIKERPSGNAAVTQQPTELIKPFVMVSGDQFMSEQIPARKVIMRTTDKGDAVFYAKSINQIFAWRGLGKTCVGLGLTAAFATGGSFLNFKTPEAVNVLYIEGELPAEQMQERWKQIIGKTNGRARLVTIDKQPEHSFPSFATAEGMARVEATLAQCAAEGFPVAVLFLDSVSTLFNIAANDEENWILIQSWFLRLRSQGLCIFFFHHAGKSGLSRSHSKSEDMLDVSIKLDKPDEQEEGILHAVMVFDKARHGISEPATEIKMRSVHTETCACKHVSGTLIGCRGDSVTWEHEATSASKKVRAFEMYATGASVRRVASELKMSKTVAGRLSVEYSQGVINAPKALEVDA
jgi:hypothetical protein